MSRYAVIPAAPPPSQPKNTFEGDQEFVGLHAKNDRDKLPNGRLSRAENNRMIRGVAQPRGGTLTPTFANIVPMTILGSGLYSNPNGEEIILIATPTEVLKIKSGSFPGSVALPAGVTLDKTPIEFVQHFDKVLLHRPDGGETLVWDGSGSGFVAITKSIPDDTSTALMPNPPWSVNFAERAIFPIPDQPDTIGVSDVRDYTSYDPILMVFRINRGTADKVVGVYPFTGNNLLVGKTRGFDVLTNFTGDLSNAGMETISSEVGTWARRSAKMVGADLFFLSADHFGVFRVNQIIQERLQTEPIAVSDNITPLIKRINWTYAQNAVANVHDIYYMLAVPLDQSTVNNALIVYNTGTGEWEGFDWWNPGAQVQIDNLLVTNYFGIPALYAINNGLGKIHVLGLGNDDQFNDEARAIPAGDLSTVFGINHLIETRGYATLGWNASSRRDFKQLQLAVATVRPSIRVTELTDGAEDERPLNTTPITRDPAKYRNFDRADFVPGNLNKDFEAPGRLDYSLDVTSVDFDLTEPGVELDIKQRDVLRFSTKARGRYMSYRVENTNGECEVSAALVESEGTQREPRKAG